MGRPEVIKTRVYSKIKEMKRSNPSEKVTLSEYLEKLDHMPGSAPSRATLLMINEGLDAESRKFLELDWYASSLDYEPSDLDWSVDLDSVLLNIFSFNLPFKRDHSVSAVFFANHKQYSRMTMNGIKVDMDQLLKNCRCVDESKTGWIEMVTIPKILIARLGVNSKFLMYAFFPNLYEKMSRAIYLQFPREKHLEMFYEKLYYPCFEDAVKNTRSMLAGLPSTYSLLENKQRNVLGEWVEKKIDMSSEFFVDTIARFSDKINTSRGLECFKGMFFHVVGKDLKHCLFDLVPDDLRLEPFSILSKLEEMQLGLVHWNQIKMRKDCQLYVDYGFECHPGANLVVKQEGHLTILWKNDHSKAILDMTGIPRKYEDRFMYSAQLAGQRFMSSWKKCSSVAKPVVYAQAYNLDKTVTYTPVNADGLKNFTVRDVFLNNRSWSAKASRLDEYWSDKANNHFGARLEYRVEFQELPSPSHLLCLVEDMTAVKPFVILKTTDLVRLKRTRFDCYRHAALLCSQLETKIQEAITRAEVSLLPSLARNRIGNQNSLLQLCNDLHKENMFFCGLQVHLIQALDSRPGDREGDRDIVRYFEFSYFDLNSSVPVLSIC